MGIADLHRVLAQHRRIGIDTLVFIYLLDEHPQYVEMAALLLKLVEQGAISGVAST